jgi:tripartite ATP-independent transporter DctM subunit
MTVGVMLIGSFLALLVIGVPIAMGMGISSMLGLLTGGYDLSVLPMLLQKGANNYTLIAIPYFVLAANLMNTGGITNRLFDCAEAWVGWMRGGLAQVNVVSSMIFAGISGTANADAAGLGLVEIRAMEKKGYDLGWSVAITLASSVIGPIIPPSVGFIVYAMLAEVSVADMFIAGVIPGVVIAAVLMITNYIIAKSGKVACPAPDKFQFSKVVETTKNGFFALMAPVILLVGIMSGVVTATETGVIAVIYSLLVGLIYRELTWKGVFEALKGTIISTSVILLMVGFGYCVGWVLTIEQVPQMLTGAMLGITQNKIVMLLIINAFLLVLGMFLDNNTIRIITIPLLLPIVDALGIDRIQFGVLHTFNLLIGMCTPPVGVGLMIMCTISGLKFSKVVRAFIPFFIPLLIALLLITYLPPVTLWLPTLLKG